MALLEVKGVVSGYRDGTVLHGVDLELDEGGAMGILGRNGVGKSTLMPVSYTHLTLPTTPYV